MAKAPPKPEASEDGATPKKKGKLMMIIIIVLIVVLIIVAGIGALLLLKKDKGHDEAATAESAAPAAAQAFVVDLSKPPTFVPLDPFTVNLRGDEGDHYLQVAVVLRVSDAKIGEGLKGFMPEIRHRINLMLSSKLPSELSTSEGREILAATIVDETNAALGFPVQVDARGRTTSAGPVQAALFNSFIIQ